MSYTVYKDNKIDQKINQDIACIVKAARNLLGNNIHSMLLHGGFGRGEGSVESRNGRPRIINDYDISIVLNEKNRFKYLLLHKEYWPRLIDLTEKLASELDIKQVDLDLRHISYFSNNILTVGNYEMLKGHILIDGRQDPCQYMPDYKPEDMSLCEGTRLLRNRGAGLLIAARYFLDNSSIIHEENRENFAIECSKAILAMGDCVLLLKHQYHFSYQERKNRIERLDLEGMPDAAAILPEYIDAIEQKLRPDFEKFYNIDMVKRWFRITGLFESFYRYFELQRLKVDFKNWIEYTELKKPGNKIIKQKLLSMLIRREINPLCCESIKRGILKARRYGFDNLVPLLLFSVRKDEFYQPYLKRAMEMLSIKTKTDPLSDWQRCTNMFFKLHHPTGEAGRFLKEA